MHVRPRVVRRSFCLRLGPPVLLGKRRASRRSMIADASAPFPSDLSAAEPHSREKGKPGVHGASPGHEPGDRGLADPTGRSIRYSARIGPLHRARTGFGPWTSGRAPPFMPQEYLTIPAFETYPFRIAHARRCGRSCRARDNAFHPATTSSFHRFQGHVNKLRLISPSMVNRKRSSALIALAVKAAFKSTLRAAPWAGQTAGIDLKRANSGFH